jgi:ERO1-like protein beta
MFTISPWVGADVSLEEGDYFDLTEIPERYTGYSGTAAHRVWSSIYEENCFGLAESSQTSGASPVPLSLPETMDGAFLKGLDRADDGDMCLEKKVYYKIISGACVTCSIY